ncbi:hypothetical protein [Salmonirosea aquatica]|uniref:Uncharacterized protein n=1 Tax=Salmonirosea aquatica TaxID=2654236 RepID=A0A7C9BLC6_9BACT|nr:hypothetical protein [Cytophagaceae bacterium SJW1-29]
MNDPMKDWKSIRIKFQTAAGLPAPYSYFYTLQLTFEGKKLGIDLELHYLDRDELDEEMILEEGFSLNDDYSWVSTLPQTWQTELTTMMDKLVPMTSEEVGENENYLVVEIQLRTDKVAVFTPNDRPAWDYFQQELIQAIYEASGKERAFEMEYLEIEARNELRIQVDASFVNRNFSVKINDAPASSLNWKWTKEVMETVFKADFLPVQNPDEEPRFSGKYLAVGDGVWYEFNETLVEPTPKSKVLPKIVLLMDQLREEAVR